MKEELIQDILGCMPEGRTKFYYFKDRYALMLLAYYVGSGMSVRKIKQSRLGKLIAKPIAQQVIKYAGSGELTFKQIGAIWPKDYHCYLLTLDKWGDRSNWTRFYNQTSRSGWNLVLQLNFSSEHNRSYYRMVKPVDDHPFKCHGHPIVQNGRHTLAWARIDLDLDTSEALIEEIQNDWIRMALESKDIVARYEANENKSGRYVPRYVRQMECNAGTLTRYVEDVLKSHMKIWDEAMLAAAVWFLKEEIGIEKIYYHTFDFGCQLKGIKYTKPPRSLYTKLPERFCFTEVNDLPIFLQENSDRRARKLLKNAKPCFYLLDLSSDSEDGPGVP